VANRNGQPPQQKELRVRNIIAGKSTTQEMVVERLSINTNDRKTAESDLMTDVANALRDQTDTLAKSLDELRKVNKDQLDSLKALSKTASSKDGVEAASKTMSSAMSDALNKLGVGGGSGGSGVDSSDTREAAEIKRLDKDMKEVLKELTNAIKGLAGAESVGSGTVPAEGATEGGGRRGPGQAQQDVRNFVKAIGFKDKIKEGTNLERMERILKVMEWREKRKAPDERDSGLVRLIGDTLVSELESGITNFADAIQRATSSVVSFSNVTDWARGRFSLALEASTSGIMSFGDAFLDLFPGLIRGGDNLVSTLKLTRSALSDGLINPIGTMGDSLEGVSESLYQTRDTLRDQGVNAMSRLGFEEANEAMIQLFALERRRDVGANISSGMTQRNMARQLEYAQMIATNTGQTALEVLKANQERARQLSNLQAGGILGGPDGENFSNAMMAFRGAGMGGFEELIAGIARAGGDPTLYLSQNSDFAQGLATTGKNAEFYDLINAIRGGADPNTIMQLAGRMGGGNLTGIAGSTTIGEQMLGLSGEAGLAKNYVPDEEPDWFISAFTWVKDAWTNMGGSDAAMLVAVGANVTALWANTAALLGGGIGGLMGRMGGLAKGAGRMAMGAGRSVIGAGAGLLSGAGGMAMGAGRSVAGAAAGMGLKSLIKKIPIIGLIAGLGFAGGRALAGDWTGAALEAASGVAGTVPGLGTAASLGLDATLAARDMGMIGSSGQSAITPLGETVGPAPPGSTTNAGIRNDTQRLILETNRLLDRILVLAQDEIDVLKDIKGNTAKTTVQAPEGFWSSLMARDEPAPASGMGTNGQP